MRLYPHKTPGFLKVLGANYIWNVANESKKIYLTFDDGPAPEITEWTLNLLSAFQAKGTFFMVGENLKKYPEIGLKVLENGHQVGNHSQTHLSGWRCSAGAYKRDVQIAQETFQKYLGFSPALFRPPYGRIRRSQGKVLQHEYDIVMWSYLSGDFEYELNFRNSIASLSKARGGDILVFHDNPKYFENLKMVLPPILENLSRDGFSFAALPDPK